MTDAKQREFLRWLDQRIAMHDENYQGSKGSGGDRYFTYKMQKEECEEIRAKFLEIVAASS
jgi:hypothetical protein